METIVRQEQHGNLVIQVLIDEDPVHPLENSDSITQFWLFGRLRKYGDTHFFGDGKLEIEYAKNQLEDLGFKFITLYEPKSLLTISRRSESKPCGFAFISQKDYSGLENEPEWNSSECDQKLIKRLWYDTYLLAFFINGECYKYKTLRGDEQIDEGAGFYGPEGIDLAIEVALNQQEL